MNWQEFKRYKRKSGFYFHFFSIFANLLLLVMPIFSLQIYNRVLTSRSVETLVYLSCIVALFLIIQCAMDYTRQQIKSNLLSIFEVCFSKKSALSLSGSFPSDDNIYRNYEKSKLYIISPFNRAITDLPWTMVFIVVLFFLHPYLGAFALLSTLVMALFSFICIFYNYSSQEKVKGLSKRQNDSLRQLYGVEKNLRSSLVAARFLDRWFLKNSQLIGIESLVKTNSERGQTLIKLLRMLIQVGVFFIGAVLVIDNEIMVGSMLASSILMSRILSPIDQGANHFITWNDAKKAFRELDEHWSNKKSFEPISFDVDTVNLSVERLTYSLPSGRDLVKNIGFNLKPGHIVSINGSSGSGKSTLLKLISQTLSPSEGKVLINGIPADKIDGEILSATMSYLPQEPKLFSATLAENICIFDQGEHVSRKIVEACDFFNCHRFIKSLERGFSTLVQTNSNELSSSEKQLISLASCYYNQPKLLLLDEPTAFLDSEGVQSVIKFLKKLKQDNASVVLVSSDDRLNEVFDYTLEIKDGSIINVEDHKKRRNESEGNKKSSAVFSPKLIKY